MGLVGGVGKLAALGFGVGAVAVIASAATVGTLTPSVVTIASAVTIGAIAVATTGLLGEKLKNAMKGPATAMTIVGIGVVAHQFPDDEAGRMGETIQDYAAGADEWVNEKWKALSSPRP